MNYFQILFELQGVSQALLDDIHHFPIHVNFQIRSRYIFKPIIHRKKQWIVLRDLRSFFRRMLFMILFMHVVSDYFFFFHFMTIWSYFSSFFICIYQLFLSCQVLYTQFFHSISNGFSLSSFPF